MKYKPLTFEDKSCVRASLKLIFLRREIEFPSNDDFADSFAINAEGIDLDQKSLNRFLHRFRLSSRHVRPNCSVIEPDMVLEEALANQNDILTAFYFNILVNANKISRHVSLVEDFQYPDLSLHDYSRPVGLDTMIKAMSQDSRCGFYLIS